MLEGVEYHGVIGARGESMRMTSIEPTVHQLAGHWYVIAGSAGFLDRAPFIETIQGYGVPLDADNYVLDCLATSPGRRHHFSKVLTNPRRNGAFTSGKFRGAGVLMRAWDMTLSSDGMVHAIVHHGSMLIPGGTLVWVRAEMSEADARVAVFSRAAEVGLTLRELETLVWRTRPSDIVVGEVPRFVAPRRSGWLQMVRAVIGTRCPTD